MRLWQQALVATKQGSIGDIAVRGNGWQVLALHGRFERGDTRDVDAATIVEQDGTVMRAPACGRYAFYVDATTGSSAWGDDQPAALVVLTNKSSIRAERISATEVLETSTIAINVGLMNAVRLDNENALIEIHETYYRDEYGPPETHEYWVQVELRSGSASERRSTPSALGVRNLLRGPGASWPVENPRMSFSEPELGPGEHPIALGSRAYLTNKRVIDAEQGIVVHQAAHDVELADLSLDEELVLEVATDGTVAVRNLVVAGAPVPSVRIASAVTFARFVGPKSTMIILGTADGSVVWLMLDR